MTGYVADLSWKSGARDWKVRSTKVDYGSECVKMMAMNWPKYVIAY